MSKERKAYYAKVLRLSRYPEMSLEIFKAWLREATRQMIKAMVLKQDRELMAEYNKTGDIYGGGISKQCLGPSTSLTAMPLYTAPSMPPSLRLACGALPAPGVVVLRDIPASPALLA